LSIGEPRTLARLEAQKIEGGYFLFIHTSGFDVRPYRAHFGRDVSRSVAAGRALARHVAAGRGLSR
jgi:hypothetical protein